MKVIKNIWKVICYPVLYMAVQVVVSVIYSIVIAIRAVFENVGISSDLSTDKITGMVLERMNLHVLLIINLSITILIIYFIKRKEWKGNRFWKIGGGTATSMLLCAFLGIAMNFFTLGVIALTNAIEIFPEYEKMSEIITSGNFILQIISIALFAPLVEEIIFRGVVLGNLYGKTKAIVAIIIQALLFAVVHMNVLQGIYAFVFGIALGLVFIWLDSLWATIIMHIAYNINSVILTKLLGNTEISHVVIIIITAISLVMVVGIMVLLYKKKSVSATPTNIPIENTLI